MTKRNREYLAEINMLVQCVDNLASGWDSSTIGVPDSIVAAMTGTINLLNARLAQVLEIHEPTISIGNFETMGQGI